MKTSNLLKFLSCIIIICIHTGLNAQIGINTDTPDSSAVLQINADRRGLLIPSLSDTGLIEKPADGLVFYNNVQKAYYLHTGNSWKIMVPFEILNDTSISTSYNITIKGAVLVQNDVTSNGNITAKGTFTANGNITANGKIIANNSLTANGAFTSNGNVTVNNNVTVNGNVSAQSYSNNLTGNGPVPKGGIIMWSGAINQIPQGWALCNGQTVNGIKTPDLTNRFIVGVGKRYNPGDIGGQDSVALKLSEMPKHNHGGGKHSHNIVAYVDAWGWNGDHRFKSDKN